MSVKDPVPERDGYAEAHVALPVVVLVVRLLVNLEELAARPPEVHEEVDALVNHVHQEETTEERRLEFDGYYKAQR